MPTGTTATGTTRRNGTTATGATTFPTGAMGSASSTESISRSETRHGPRRRTTATRISTTTSSGRRRCLMQIPLPPISSTSLPGSTSSVRRPSASACLAQLTTSTPVSRGFLSSTSTSIRCRYSRFLSTTSRRRASVISTATTPSTAAATRRRSTATRRGRGRTTMPSAWTRTIASPCL